MVSKAIAWAAARTHTGAMLRILKGRPAEERMVKENLRKQQERQQQQARQARA